MNPQFNHLNVEFSEGLRVRNGTTQTYELISGSGKLYDRYTHETFDQIPTCTLNDGYSSPTGAGGDVNVMRTAYNTFEYEMKGTQTLVAPAWDTNGLNIAFDQTDNDGVEISQGNVARSAGVFTVGTDAFFFEMTIQIATVAGTDDCCIGFRKVEAYQANVDDYDEAVFFNLNAGNILIESILNGGATQTVDTTSDVSDATAVTLRIEVDINGAATFFINGSAPDVGQTFTFDSGEVVKAFLFMLQANASQTGATYIQKWESGKINSASS